jgi:hypothetical protein
MRTQVKTIEEIHTTLQKVRGNSNFRNKFPKQIWNEIIELTKDVPFQDVCRQLEIQPAYLKRKMQQLHNNNPDVIDFQEISCNIQDSTITDAVVIELISDSGLRAKIQGPSTCLNFLSSLFGGK